MKVLLAHNFYQQPGGEDQAFAAEGSLLEAHGHEIIRYTVHNNQVEDLNKVRLATATVWNSIVYKELRNLVQKERPQLVHFHNTFPLLSPSAYYAAHAEGVPVVQTLHNYRLSCLNATFFRNGKPCEDCLKKVIPWPGLVHACYRNNRLASTGIATMLIAHRALRTWDKKVDAYIALTEAGRNKFIQAGLPEEKILIKPNFVYPDPGIGGGEGNYALYVGRLTQEKGITILLKAWELLKTKIPLKIVGDGPLSEKVVTGTNRIPQVKWMGYQQRGDVLELMKNAMVLIVPSLWYEGFPMVILEAFAVGLPVVSSNIGGMSSLIVEGKTGFLYEPGNAGALAKRIEWVERNLKTRWVRQLVRKEFEDKYTEAHNYKTIMEIYQFAQNKSRQLQRSPLTL